MALDFFTGVFTAAQIVLLAERRGGNPGLQLDSTGVESLSAPAYLELQALLDSLAVNHTWTFKRLALDINLASQINPLPTNFWRVGFADPCWLIDPTSGNRTRFRLLDAETFHDRLAGNVAPSPPDVGYLNRENGTLVVEAAPDKVYVLELHYYPWQPALSAINAQPWFPYSEYLIEALLCKTYLSQDDSRWQISNAERGRMMKEIKGSLGDARDRGSFKLDLDPVVFRRPLEL